MPITSDKFLEGLNFMLEADIPLDNSTVPKLLAKMADIENPDATIGEIKGLMETMQEMEYTPHLQKFTTDKIKDIMEREGISEPELGGGGDWLC